MQNPSFYSPVNPQPPQFPDQEHLNCPRCDSANTKFCYYNNYNLSQPRHFCKNCKRYWTKGGALRNIPVGGSSRKNSKRGSSSASASAASNNHQTKRPAATSPKEAIIPPKAESTHLMQFGGFPEGDGSFGPVRGGEPLGFADMGSGRESGGRMGPESGRSNINTGNNGDDQEYVNVEDCGNAWPHLAMYNMPSSDYDQ